MRWGMRALSCLAILVSSFVVLSTAGCGGSPSVGSVTVTAAATTVDGTDATTLTATVADDRNSAGVSWSTSAGTLSGTSTTAATITLPAATSSSQTVTVTATSIADTTKSGTAVITVPAAPAVTSLTTAQLSVAVGTAYSVTLAGTGGIPPYKNWAVASGTLPSCLSLNAATGALTSTGASSVGGVPSAACVNVGATVKFSMSDSGTATALTATSSAQTFVVTGPTLTFPTSLPAASVGTAYSASAAATGAIGTTTYTLTGSFPTSGNLKFNSTTGAITGTPYAADAGTYTFTVQVTDQYGDSASSGNLTLKINAPTITFPSSLAGANVGVAYSASAAATGTLGTTTYVLNGSLPASGHLTFNTSTGAITGTPYAVDAGTSTFTVSVTDQYGDTATSGSLSIKVTAPTITFATPTATANVGVAYSSSAGASGALGTTTYAIVSGTLPTSGHLALNTSTGAITGTPYAADTGLYTFQVSVTDQWGDTATSAPLSITVTAPTITFPSSLAGGNVGTPYNASVAATGAVGTTTYTVNSGALSTSGHLTLNASTGAITGTPYAADAGTSTFTIKVTDQYGDTATSGLLSIAITAPTITFATPAATANVGVAYSSSAAASGTVGTTTYAIASGSLPASEHLVFNTSTGAITGTPYAADAGTSTFTVSVTDQYGDTATSGSETITINAPTITFNANVPAGTVGSLYSGSVTASGTVGTTTYSLVGGSLPAGHLTFNTTTGAITGTPYATDVAGSPYTFKIQATDQWGDTATSATQSLVINPAGAITFGTAPTATATAGVAYSSGVSASGGAGTLTYSIATGAMPNGLTFNSSTGAITGTPLQAIAQNFTIQASDAFGDSAVSPFYTITVNPGAAAYFKIGAPGAATAGVQTNFVVQAFDAYNDLATNYSGTVTFMSSDAQAALPANSMLTNGQGNFLVTLKTAGSQTITATDTVNGTITGVSSPIVVSPGAYTTLLVTAPSTATVGAQFNFTAIAKDSYGNTISSNDSLSFTSSDSAAVIPSGSLSNGTGTFQATLNTTGSQTIGAHDGTSGASGTSNTITVSNALSISPSTLPSADDGSAYSFTLTAAGGAGAPYTFSTTGPSTLSNFNLTLDSSGLIHGSPSGTGTATFTAQVVDSASNKTTLALSIPVYGGLSLPNPDPASLPSTGLTNQTYAGSIQATGGTGTYQWAVNGTVVTGAGVSLGNGTLTATVSPGGNVLDINGAPATTSAVSFSVKLTDTAANNVSLIQGPYTITISNPVAVSLPTPSATVPGSGTVSNPYNSSITAMNGVPPYTWTVNGNPTTGPGYSLGDGITAGSTGNTLTFSGMPTSATTIGPFTVKVTDSTLPTATTDTKSYSIVVNPSGGTVSGQIFLNNICNISTWPVFTVTLTNTATSATIQQTTTNGSFVFSSVPDGTYNISPSISGATSSLFYPASIQNVVITDGSNINNQYFNAAVGYTVSGNVTYGGTQTGQTYLYLQNNNCGGNNGNPGTSITEATLTAGGAYTIRGVPPGSYSLYAWMDSTGITSGTDYPGPQGAPNINNPTGSNTSVSVTNASVTTANVTMTDPATYATPPSNPSFQVIPTNGGWILMYSPPTVNTSNGAQQEAANEYLVQWAVPTGTDSAKNPTCALGGGTGGAQFGTIAGSHTFYATGNGSTAWILNNTSMGAGTFNGGAYCFQARAFNTLASTTHPSGWYDYTDPASSSDPLAVAPVTSNTFCTTNCTAVSGTVTIPAGVAIGTGAPLYIGYLQESGNSGNPSAIYATEIASPVSGANSFSLTIPNGSGYALFAIYDENNDGAIDAYDVTNAMGDNVFANPVTFNGTPVTNASLTLPSVNSMVQVETQYYSSNCSGCSPSYSLNLRVGEQNKLPVSVTLSNTSVGTPYLMMPVDISLCTDCGNNQYGYYVNLPGGTPSVGDSFDFTVTYSDGSHDTGTTVNGAVTAFGATGAVVGANDLPTGLQATTGTTPNFSWTPSSNALGDSFYYSFYLNQESGTCPSNNCTIWQIPAEDSKSNGFASSITSLTWGIDPTGGGSTPSGALDPSLDYSWSITVQDSNGNQAQASTNDNNP